MQNETFYLLVSARPFAKSENFLYEIDERYPLDATIYLLL